MPASEDTPSFRVWGEYWLKKGWSCEEVNHALTELHRRTAAGEDEITVFGELNRRRHTGHLLPGEKDEDER